MPAMHVSPCQIEAGDATRTRNIQLGRHFRSIPLIPHYPPVIGHKCLSVQGLRLVEQTRLNPDGTVQYARMVRNGTKYGTKNRTES